MNLLNPSDFGLMRYVTIVLGIANLINEAGLGVALVQKKQLNKNEIASSFSLTIVVCLGLYCMIFIFAPLIASFFANTQIVDLVRIGGLSAPIGGISIVQRGLMQRRFQYGRLSLIEAISALGGSITGIILGVLGFGVWSLIWSVLLYSSISSLLSIGSGRIQGNFHDVKTSMALWVFGLGAVIQRIIDYATSNIDYIVVGRYFGEIALGIYSMAFTITMLPQLALGAVLANVALSAFSRFQDDDMRLRGAFLRLTKVVTLLSIPYFILLFILAPELMKAVAFIHHSDKWVPAAPFIKILAPVGLLYCLNSFPGIVWIAKGKVRFRIVWAAFSLLTMGIAVIIGSRFGVSGICIAILARAIIVFPVSQYANYRTFGLAPKDYLKVIVPPFCCGVVALIALQGLSMMGTLHAEKYSYLKIACYSAVCLGIYGGMLRIVSKNSYRDLRDVFEEFVGRKFNAFFAKGNP
jgi:teichuronic acid exporter